MKETRFFDEVFANFIREAEEMAAAKRENDDMDYDKTLEYL